MNLLDALLLACSVLAGFSGYRRGALLQLITYVGLSVGLVCGALLAPKIAATGHGLVAQAALAAGTILVIGAAGDGLGWLVGSKIRAKAHKTRARRADAAGGSAVSVVAVLLATWFVALNLVNGPFPTMARQIRGSAIVRVLGDALPQPPSLVGEVRRFFNVLGFPDVFLGLPPDPGAPVEPPSQAEANAAFLAARASVVQIQGRACDMILEGSGFVVSQGYVLTNAHVIAGETDPQVFSGGQAYAATPVLFDPSLDVAVLHVPGLPAPSLFLVRGELRRGAKGAVIGYPEGGPLTGAKAAVRASISAVGRDIYGAGEVVRDVYELQAIVRPGNSGGPFVLVSGQVGGVVFAASTTDERIGYAISSAEVLPLVQEAAGDRGPVGTGACTR